MGLRPLRMKVWWGCPPRVLSTSLHRTQSWRPCLPGRPWVLGWRSTDRPVLNPRGWMIGFSERGTAHNRVLLRCLFSGGAWGADEVVDGPFHGQKLLVSSVLTTLDGGAARGYTGIPQVERAAAVHLCSRNASTWQGCQAGLFDDTVEGFAQQFSAVKQQTEAIQHILPRRDAPTTAAPGARPLVSSCSAPGWSDRPAHRASHRRAAPLASQPGPKSSRKSTKRPWRGKPGDVGVCSFSGDGENSASPSLGGGPGGEPYVSFFFVTPLVQFPFPPGSQVHGMTVCNVLLPHSRPRPILPAAKRVRSGDAVPPHAPLASPVWDPGSSARMPQNAPPSVPSSPTPFRCTTTGPSIVPLEPLAWRLEAWLTLYFSLTEGPLGTDALAHSWPQAICKYAFPPVSLLAQTLCKLREDEE